MNFKSSMTASANRRRIFFNLYNQNQTNQDKQQDNDENKESKKAVCFWTDEQYVSER